MDANNKVEGQKVSDQEKMARAQEIGEMLAECVCYYLREVAGDEPKDVQRMSIACMTQTLIPGGRP